MITESKLKTLGFHKIVWNRTISEHWLPLHKPTGDQVIDMDCSLSVRFNEFKDEPGPMVYLIIRGMMRLPHIKEISQLVQLYELVAGRSIGMGTTKRTMITRRPLWKRVFWIPRAFYGHYKLHRKHHGRIRSCYLAWHLAKLLFK